MVVAVTPRRIDGREPDGLVYSFCTLATNLPEYQAMIAAFAAKGFTDQDCEYLYIDNASGTTLDAFAGYNVFLGTARGTYIILCHQDILPIVDDRSTLDRCLRELTGRDPYWGLCGNAGYNDRGEPAFRITDPRGEQNFGEPYPAPVISLDENFIVVRRAANLALSRDLSGFHWYGSDLCLIAATLGWTAYVIDFHLRHNSGGTTDASFIRAGDRLQRKYQHAFRSRWQFVATDQPVYLSASPMRAQMAKQVRRVLDRTRQVYWPARRKAGALIRAILSAGQ